MAAHVARSVGYASEAAFSTAFKRIMGRSPRQRMTAGRFLANSCRARSDRQPNGGPTHPAE